MLPLLKMLDHSLRWSHEGVLSTEIYECACQQLLVAQLFLASASGPRALAWERVKLAWISFTSGIVKRSVRIA